MTGKEAGITAGVLVQASGNIEDTELMLETAYKTDWICGIVGWLPLMDTKATQQLLEERFLKEKYFKGVRHQYTTRKIQMVIATSSDRKFKIACIF
jgi:L-fuconolactonase